MKASKARIKAKQKIDYYSVALLIIFILGIGFRISLAYFNKYTPDDHKEVIDLIRSQGIIPDIQSCFMCYGPKLYYVAVAGLLNAAGISDPGQETQFVQLINAALGIATLYIIYSIFRRINCPDIVRLITLSLIILNPRLIMLNSDMSNNSLVILLSTLAIYYCYQYINSDRKIDFVLATACSILASLTKKNGLIVVFIVMAILIARAVFKFRFTPRRTGAIAAAVIFILIALAIVPYFGQYYSNYKITGSFFSDPEKIAEFPPLFDSTPFPWAGINSVSSGFFTFRLFDLIKEPQLVNDPFEAPVHRTSLWTILYATLNSIYYFDFEFTNDNQFLLVGLRLTLILAVIPMLIMVFSLLYGTASAAKEIVRSIKDRRSLISWLRKNIYLAFALGFIGFIILSGLIYRVYNRMNVVYILPATLAFSIVFQEGFSRIFIFLSGNDRRESNEADISSRKTDMKRILLSIIIFMCFALLACYFVQLVYKLAFLRFVFLNT